MAILEVWSGNLLFYNRFRKSVVSPIILIGMQSRYFQTAGTLHQYLLGQVTKIMISLLADTIALLS
jgi:hypothetical protein